MAIQLSGSLEMLGNIIASGGITGSFSGSATSASYADTLQGLGSASFAPAGTFNTVSQSFATTSGSLSTRVTNLESTSSTVSSSFAITSGSLSTRVTNLESTSSTVSSSFATTSGSISSRVTLIEGQYATTGSNTFNNIQYISSSTNAQGFTTTASLYTDGGLRVGKDSFVSGTAYFNNVVVYGTSSIQYITSSQVNIGASYINLNTNLPAQRYGGINVADSGSNVGVTGSLLWDSLNNRWIYANPSGSTYDGGMLISGPRNTTGLGNEVGTTACYLMAGQGADHITSSAIYTDTNATCFYSNALVVGSNCCIGIGTTTPTYDLTLSKSVAAGNVILNLENTSTTGAARLWFGNNASSSGARIQYFGATHAVRPNLFSIGTDAANDMIFETSGTERARITSTGAVGIGSNAPTTDDGNLVVAGCVGTGQGITCTTAQINIWETTSGNKAGLWFGAVNCANVGVIGSRTATGNIAFQTYCGGWGERMRIAYNGNVGIGTTNPTQILNVYSPASSGQSYLIMAQTSGSAALFTARTSTTSTYFGTENSSAGSTINGTLANASFFANQSANALQFGTNNNVRLTIDSTGIACFACQVCANSTGGISGVFTSCNFFGSIDLENTGGAATGKWNVQSVSGAQIGGSAGSSFGIYSYGASAYRLFINSLGNVGIGTTSPSYKLDICTSQSIRVIGSSTGYTQGSIIFQSSTTDTPEARGLGVYAFNEGTDATWFYGTAYNAADSFVVNRKAGTTYQDSAASVGESSTFLLINNTGRVGLGTTNLSTEANLFLGAQGTTEGGQLVLQKGTSYQCATHLDNYTNQFRILSGTDTTTTAAHMILDHTTMNACFYGTLTAPIITSTANNVSISGKAFLTTLATSNALYIITAQPEAGSGTSAAALITSRTNQNPSVQTIVSSSSLSFFTDGYNLCLCSNLGYGLSARWGIIRLA